MDISVGILGTFPTYNPRSTSASTFTTTLTPTSTLAPTFSPTSTSTPAFVTSATSATTASIAPASLSTITSIPASTTASPVLLAPVPRSALSETHEKVGFLAAKAVAIAAGFDLPQIHQDVDMTTNTTMTLTGERDPCIYTAGEDTEG